MTFSCKTLKTLKRMNILLILCLCGFIILSYRASIPLSSSGIVRNAERQTSYEKVGESGRVRVIEDASQTKRKNTTVRWTYSCSRNACIRREAKEEERLVDFDVCWLTCGSHGSVWPFPRKYVRSPETVQFLPENIRLMDVGAKTESVRQLVENAFRIKQRYFDKYPGLKTRSKGFYFSWPFNLSGRERKNDDFTQNVIKVYINTNQTDELLTLHTDEAYEISIEEGNYFTATTEQQIQLTVKITGSTFFGVRHGIETFSQLVALDKINGCLQILRGYYAYDKPHFPYRGLLIDSSRNFIPMNVIKRVVDGMAFNKLNMLHMHLSDSNTFPFHSKSVPQMTDYGALSPDEIYYAEELKELVQYAKVRGVKVIPELDAPSHAGNGWQFGKKYGLGDLAFYINAYDDSWVRTCGQPPCGILNPANNNTYDILERLYADLLDIFDHDLFHMGGDEVNLNSWQRRSELKEMLKGKTPMDLWKYFQTEAFQRLKKHSTNVTAIMWTSHLTQEWNVNKTLPSKDYIIQAWGALDKQTARHLLGSGYSVIVSVSNQLYLDWGCGTWLGKNHDWKYLTWQLQYDANRKFLLTNNPKDMQQVLGAEGTLWGEKVGPHDLEVKLWPRAAALAEGFWSNPQDRDGEVFTRINYHNHRLRQRGIPTSQLQPESCLHFNGHCEHPYDIL